MKWTVVVDGEIFEIEIGAGGRTSVNQQPCEVDLKAVGSQYSLLIDHRSYEVQVSRSVGDSCWLTVEGRPFQARLRRGFRGNGEVGTRTLEGSESLREPDRPSRSMEVRAPLPGLLVEMHASEGDDIEEGDVVAIVESMKMNLELPAPRGGVVRELCALPGNHVPQDAVLAIIDPDGNSHSDGRD